MRYLVEVHARPLRRSCECVGLSRVAWCRPPLDLTVRDAELIAALAGLVEDHSGWGFWSVASSCAGAGRSGATRGSIACTRQ